MAKITVYKGKPHLTLLSWLGMAMIFGSLAQLFDKAVSSAYLSFLMGLYLIVFAGRRAAGQKMRISGKAAAIFILLYFVFDLIQKLLDGNLTQMLDFSDLSILLVYGKTLIWLVLAVLLLLPTTSNKPVMAGLCCFGVLLLNLFSIVSLLTVSVSTYSYVLLGFLLLPAVPGLILMLRSLKMSDAEKQVYVF